MHLISDKRISLIKNLVKCLGFIIFFIILYKIDYTHIKEIIGSGQNSLLYLAFGIIAVSFPLGGGRYYMILRGQGIHISITGALKIYFHSSFLGFISPGRIGTASRIAYLHQYNVPFIKKFSNVFLDKLIDGGCVVICLWLSILFIDNRFVHYLSEYFLSVSIICICLIVLTYCFKNRIGKLGRSKFRKTIYEFIALKYFHVILLITFGLWAMHFSCFYLINKALMFNISFMTIVFCVTSSSLISIIPVSIAGIGTRDAWMIFIFRWLGYETEKAVLFSSAFLIIYIELLVISSMSLLIKNGKNRKNTS